MSVQPGPPAQDISSTLISTVSAPGVCCPAPSSRCRQPQAGSSCYGSRVRSTCAPCRSCMPRSMAASNQYPAYLVVDLARMTFCSVRGLDLLIQAGRIAAERETGYAVTGVLPQIHRAWTLCWGNDRPIYYRSTAAAVTKSGLSGAEGAPGPWPDYHPVLEIVVVGCRVGMASHAWSRPDLVRARPARRCSASLVLDATGGWPLRGVTANLADFLLVSPVRDLSVVVSAVDRWGIDVSAVGWRPCSSVLAVSSGSRAGLVSGRGGAAWPSSWIRAVGSVLG